LANPLRLTLLNHLSRLPEQYVKAVALEFGLAEDVASKNLQMLASGGFLKCESVSKYRYYSLAKKDDLLRPVLNALKTRDEVDSIMYMLTALTHERRVRAVCLLSRAPMEMICVCRQVGMSWQAAQRHLDKLIRRGWVKNDNETYSLCFPPDRLGRALIKWVKNDSTLAQVWKTESGEML
jgi:DNA-binding IclR family transcriptional regulator